MGMGRSVHPMRWMLLLALAPLAASLAGCSSGGDAEGSKDDGVRVVTDPSDYSYLQNGTDQGFHVHDYWGGQDRLSVLDQEGGMAFLLNGGQYGERVFRPADADVIPQGTASVETTVTWEDDRPGNYGRLELWVKTQNESATRLVGELQQGVALPFATTLADADLPHQQLSAWEFAIRVYTPEDQPTQPLGIPTRSYELQLTIYAEAVRGLELPAFPPHPDHWQGSTELPLLAQASGETQLWSEEPPACGYCSGGIGIVDPDNGTIVPPDAAAVEVTMTYARETPTGLRLLYHGANSRDWLDAPIASDDGSKRIHVIPLESNGDGPYADQTLWEFYFGFEDGNGPYRGEWTLSARVLKQMP
jgi:hypothetical protein